MKIYNFAENLVRCVGRWETLPSPKEFSEQYYAPMAEWVGDAMGDANDLYSLLRRLDWDTYRARIVKLDPAHEEARLRKNLQAVEDLFGFKLEGEAVLFGSFEAMDGYARFDRGTHRVFLGIDESFDRGKYLDILETHELTHVARESRPETWIDWGFDPKMTHDEFVQNQPTIEHLFGEGFSCSVSEILIPGQDPWEYAYQTRDGLNQILTHGDAVDLTIHENIGRSIEDAHEGNWGALYSPISYRPRLPVFTHYVWAWQWTKRLIQDRGQGHPKKLIQINSREFFDHARGFRLADFKRE